MESTNSIITKKPLVSVIISVYNEEKYIYEAVKSIINQTYKNLEIIVIDDYSTDNSISIVNQINDPRIIIYRKITEPRYLAASRNIGINLANGDYITLHDADDTCSNDRIEKQLKKAIELDGNAVVGCYVNKIFPDGNIIKMNLPSAHDDIIKGFTRIRNRATIVSGTILTSKSIFKKFQYNENLKYAQDWDHMLRMYESNFIEFYNIPEYLYNYFQRPKNVSAKPDWPDYNILIRINQKRRQTNEEEFANINELYIYLHNNPIKYVEWSIFKFLIRLNVRLSKVFKR